MSSICRKQKSLSSLYAILCMTNVVSHTQRHERKLAKKRANKVNVQDRLIRGENIWNLCIIDNIDFCEETFTYDNIFDTTRKTMHATLRMVFQFKLSHLLLKIITESKLITDYHFYIGISIFIKDELWKFEDTFGLLLNLYGENFEIQQVHEELWKSWKWDIKLNHQMW